MSQQQRPQWQPISMLPKLAQHIDGMLEADQEQYQILLAAKPKPYVLDDYTVNRVIAAFTTQAKDFWVFEEQLRLWNAGPLSAAQRQEITRLAEQMRLLRENNEAVLRLARELSQGTIEKQLAKSDEQLGFEQIMRILGGGGKV